jgi:hypothetical protein
VKQPFLGVPSGPGFNVENPDGVYTGAAQKHSLYDRAIVEPVIPGDFDVCVDIRPVNDAGRLHGK